MTTIIRIRGSILLGLLCLTGVSVFAANSANASPFAVLHETVIDGGIQSYGSYGDGQIEPIGDFDQNGTEDFIVGAYRSYLDTGAAFIEMLNADGSYKGRYPIAPSSYGAQKALFGSVGQFGAGLAVLKKFTSSSTSCAEIIGVTNRASNHATYVVELCRSGTNVIPRIELKTDTTISALAQTGLAPSLYGNTVKLVDTLASGELLVAFSAMFANNYTGRIYLMALNSARTNWRRVGIISDTSAALVGKIHSGDVFGASLAVIPDLDNDGVNDLMVLAQEDDEYKTNHGAVYIIPLDVNAQVASGIKKITGAQLPELQGLSQIAWSIASADMNHDGVSDLILGSYMYTGSFTSEGSLSIATLKNNGSVDSLAVLRKGSMGFVDANNQVDRSSYAIGIRALAYDFDQDKMMDILGASLSHQTYGGIWAFRMKSGPWVKNKAVVASLPAATPSSNPKILLGLDTIFGGNGLSYSLTYTGDPSIATCMIVANSLACYSQANTADTKVTIQVMDAGNVPATNQFPLSFDIPVHVFAGNLAPTTSLPVALQIDEDFSEQDLLDLSTYFQDDGKAQALSYTLSQSGTALQASLNGTKLHIASVANAVGDVILTVTAFDGLVSIQPQLTLTIIPKPDAPVATKDSISTQEDQALTVAVLANDSDVDGDVLSLAAVGTPSHGTTQIQGTSILYSPALNFNGLDTLRYRVTDGALEAEGLLVILVNAVNDAPIASSPYADSSILEDSAPFTLNLSSVFTDAESPSSALMLQLLQGCDPSLAETKMIPLQAGILQISPVANANGRCEIVVQASDSQGATTKDSILIIISPIPDIYQFEWTDHPHIIQLLKSQDVAVVFPKEDLDGEALLFQWQDLPKWLLWDSSSNTLSSVTGELRVDCIVKVAVFAGSNTIPSDTSTVVLLNVDQVSALQPSLAAMTRLNLPSATFAIRDFSGKYLASLFTLDGRLLWSLSSFKRGGEDLNLRPVSMGNNSILRLRHGNTIQSLSIHTP